MAPSEHTREYQRAWKKANREKVRAYNREWRRQEKHAQKGKG